MDRTIKFRGKSKKDGKWLYGDLIENQGRYYIYHATSETTLQDNDENIVVVADIVHSDTIGQYTTVNDVNDKPAYKGDIVMAFSGKKSFPYQIVFHDGCFRLADGDGRLWHNIDDLPFEVIGNIFDNKSLLED